jgi:NTP pyrophosphatase (non-canonical NTP hydrolase)
MNKSINELQLQVDEWIKTVGVRYYSELTNMAILTEEVGELARLMARTYGDQSFKNKEADADMGEEMADILFVLLCLANQTGVNLEKAFTEKMRKRTERDRERHQNNPKLHS